MAFADVKLPQALWQSMGVAHIFYSGEFPKESLTPTSQTARPVKIAEHPASETAQRQVADQTPKWRSETSGSNQTIQRDVMPPAQSPAPFKPLQSSLWPLDWRKFLSHTPQGKIAWTYWNLAADLAAGKSQAGDVEARQKRSALFRRFFSDLAKPAGTHVFWPACLPDENGAPAANPRVFWSGVLELNCRGVVILGSQAAHSLLPEKNLRPLDELRMAGRIVWIMRDPDALVDNESWYDLALSLLKNAFQSHIR